MSPALRTSLCIVCVSIAVCIQYALGFSRPSTIVLENNEYKNVVIAIHDSVAEDKAFIEKLKDTMTKATKHLYTATRQRAHFKEIKILLPSSWSNDASYQVPTSETLSFADVIITDPIRGKRSLPQTRSYDGCGKQGVHVLLTKEFLTKDDQAPYNNNTAKYFIHAFAQFRWGVFQEYAEEGEPVFYFSTSSGQPEAIKCTFYLRGLVQKNNSAQTICYSELLADRRHVVASVDPKTGLYQSECEWKPYASHQRARSSLMDHPWIAEIETFCDDNQTNYMTVHNYEAPSKHNRLCGHRSTWDIITNTDDFRNGRNPARHIEDAQLTPTFIVMRAQSRTRRAAILINPLLTEEPHKLNIVQQALGHLKHETNDLDLYHWRARGHTISEQQLHLVENLNSLLKQSYVGEDGHDFETYTKTAIRTYAQERTASDTHLILVTDTSTESLRHILDEAKHSGLKISTISNHSTYDINHAEALGMYTIGNTHGHTLLDRLRHVISDDSTKHVIVTQEELQVSRVQPAFSYIDIDRTLANRITFIFHFDGDLPYIDIRSPSNVIYDTEADVCTVDYDYKVIRFQFEFIEVGPWRCILTQSSLKPQKVQLTVLSEDNTSKSDPIVMRHSVKFADDRNNSLLLHVDATQGTYPVLGLNVTARIETPNGNTATMQLLDNGAGVDTSKNDGIYSRTYLAPRLTGSYHVIFVVIGKHGNLMKEEESFTDTMDSDDMNVVYRRSSTDDIQRHIFSATMSIDQSANSELDNDVIAPSRITDLEVVKYIPYRNTMVLKWTAPGDDYDHGKAESYELFIGYGIKDIPLFLTYISTGMYEGQGHVTKARATAKASATECEFLLWDVNVVAKWYVFAVRAVDGGGNKADISNVATAATFLKNTVN